MQLIVRDAAIGYDRNRPLQSNINFSVASGEVCCILGPNGCGKSTLVKTIIGLGDLFEGAITVDGSDVTKWSAARLSDTIAYVAQRHNQPFPYLVKDIVMLGRINKMRSASGQPTRKDYNVVENVLDEMGILHLRDEPYNDISGGELQMVMFARALAQEPAMLILDEPTAALDYGNAVRVIEKIRQLRRSGYAVLMITHNPDHAFMTGANVALFTRNKPMRFGSAYQIITRENIQDAYGINVKLVEFTHDNQEVMRMCAPEFGGAEEEEPAAEPAATSDSAATCEPAAAPEAEAAGAPTPVPEQPIREQESN